MGSDGLFDPIIFLSVTLFLNIIIRKKNINFVEVTIENQKQLS